MTDVGLRTVYGGVAAPPYTSGPYTWDQALTLTNGFTVTGTTAFTGNHTQTGDLAITGDLDINGTLTFGDAATDNLSVTGYYSQTYAGTAANAMGITASGALTAGLNGLKITLSSATYSTTSHGIHVLMSGAGTGAGSYGLYVNSTGANAEGIFVDAGTSQFDEAVTLGTSAYLYFRDTATYIYSSGANVLAITGPTTTITGATKINLDGPTDVTGILTIDNAGSPADGIKINATTPADGLEISSACSANAINISGAPTATGIKMLGGASYNPLHIGVKSNSADAGLILTGATDDTGGIMVFCDDGGDALGSITSPIWARYLITTNQGTGGPTATGTYIQTKNLAATFATGSYTALKAFYQVGGATVLNGTATELSIINAGISYEGNLTVTNGTCSGIDININDGGYTIGTHSGLIVRKTAGSTLGWTTGITISDAGAVTGIAIGTTTTGMTIAACTTGISITTVTTGISITGTGATASAKALSTSGFTLNNGNLTDGYGIVESELTLTGIVAGHVSALSSWINMASVTTGGNYICAQTNGLWSDSGGVLTNGVFIFGMRAQCLLQTNGGVSGAKFYPFSVVNNTNITTALLKCNAGSSDVGTTAVSKTTEGKYVPLYEDDAGVHYVLIYN